MKVILKRDVPTSECPWLEEDLKKGQELFTYKGSTYGCISPGGVACCTVEDKTPFFEVPGNALHNLDEEDAAGSTQPFIEVEKLDSLTGEPHPNGIEGGYTRQGVMIKKPTVGEGFLVSRIGGYFRSSAVTEILENGEQGGKFKTKNSIYKWTKIPTNAEKETEAAE